jgi:hypothetical protein
MRKKGKLRSQKEAYKWFAEKMDTLKELIQIGTFLIEQCTEAIE